MNLNRLTIIGRLTQDPVIGGEQSKFSVAVNKNFKYKDGTKHQDTEFFNVVCNGKTTKSAASLLKKGSVVYVEGEVHLRVWEVGGETRKSMELTADKIQFIN